MNGDLFYGLQVLIGDQSGNFIADDVGIVIFFLARLGIVDHIWLAKNRKFALLIGFVIGAALTPPDVFSQTALALPFFVLYEVGIWVARFFGKKPEEG